ncbi:piggyBac transposable element-derived protein 4 [Aplysia californica]|uniref:PiggyBac transposable element-derived protein 4 n=1 Tax=Aplysia californica TaxID=6500 RepID=A0ABM0JQ93_APLCA|nr:piggyBac transposable element-derived protein 4 [Aplysia californica]
MEPGPSRPRRHTAEQACLLFETTLSESEEESDIDTPSFSGSESDNQNVQPPPMKQRRMDPTIDDSRPTDVPDWSEVTSGETNNNFRFAPPNGSGLQANLTVDSSPLDCFNVLFTAQVITYMVNSINAYAEHRCALNNPPRRQSLFANWYKVTVSELYKFFAVIVEMGIDPAISIREYFVSEDSPNYKKWYHNMFARPRFEALYHSMLHCAESAVADSKAKIEPFMNMLLMNFRTAFYPYQNLALDEMVVGYQGGWAYKMFNPSKPKKCDIKILGLYDSATGYVLNLWTYFGEQMSYKPDCDQDGSQAVKVFETLLEPFSKGHHIFADKCHTSMKLVSALSANGFYYTGTVNSNRQGFPPQLHSNHPSLGECKWYLTSHKDVDILCAAWWDKKADKPVVICSTRSSVQMVTQVIRRNTTEKPAVIQSYNENINGCDRADQQSGHYGLFSRKTVKWWKKLFYFMLELCQTNAHVLYSLSHEKRISLLDFKKKLVKGLTKLSVLTMTDEEKAREEARHPGRPAVSLPERFVGNKHLVAHSPNDRICHYCSKGTGKRMRTNFFCSGCSTKPHLHPKDCFERYHTDKNFVV